MPENPIRLPQLLSQTDALTSQMTVEELRNFIREIARTFPEGERSPFLSKLQEIQKEEKSWTAAADHEKIKQEIRMIMKKFSEIQEGEICLDSECNEEWDDWNDSDEEEFLFSDPRKLLPDVQQAIKMIHACIDQEFFGELPAELAECLSVLEIQTDGDYGDYNGSPMTICDLYEYDLLKGDYHNVVKECLYLTYMGTPAEKRSEKLFVMIQNMESGYSVRMEEIIQMGKGELQEFDRFLKDWIRYLGSQNGKWTEHLLAEAQSMISDDEVLLENARSFAQTHPSLYLLYLKRRGNAQTGESLLAVGCEALAEIPAFYVIRAQVALLTAGYANQLQKWEKAEECWLEAFRSDTSVVNYMRLRLETSNWERYKKTVRNIIEDRFLKSKAQPEWMAADECQKNRVSRNTYCTLMFLEQDFEQMRKTGMATKDALGWSGTFMKEGISLMMLLLYADNANVGSLPVGLQEMQRRAGDACDFQQEAYEQGIPGLQRGEDCDRLFDVLFARWKSTVLLSEEEQKCWLQRIDRWMERRVQGIIQNGRRNYYDECAAFLAALSEVMESRGERGAKERYFARYRSQYPRHRAFIGAMQQYGMNG